MQKPFSIILNKGHSLSGELLLLLQLKRLALQSSNLNASLFVEVLA
jgi:hypothetical protein